VLNQDGVVMAPATFAGKVYLADFFFTTCPTIYLGMQLQMLRVYKQYEGNPQVAFLSHTIDPDHDTLPVLCESAAGWASLLPNDGTSLRRRATPFSRWPGST
jgi:protein SCO1/2